MPSERASFLPVRLAGPVRSEGEELMVQVGNGMPASALRGVVWRKSHFSNPNGNCVEVAELPGGAIAVRDSRDPGGPALVYTAAGMTAFIWGVKDGQFDYLMRLSGALGNNRARWAIAAGRWDTWRVRLRRLRPVEQA
jgi:Domain of unknown function (DUF397)